MTFLLAAIFSGLGSFRLHHIILWTLVIMALFNSTIETKQTWGVYHYYIGAKYFNEFGYFDLYECSISEPTIRRDLKSYNFRRDQPDCKAKITVSRYWQLHQDMNAIGFYPGILRDKGLNATPGWIALAELAINTGIATVKNVWLFDVIALVIALLFLLRFTGWTNTGYVLLFILTFYGTQDRLWGHFGQWLWLSATLIGVSLLHKNKESGGLWLGVACGLAVFPIFLMVHYRRLETFKYFVFGLGAMLLIGLCTSRGLNAYPEFLEKMKIHSQYIEHELCCNIGLTHSITWTANPNLDYRNCFASYGDCLFSYMPDRKPGYWLMLSPLVMTSTLGILYACLTLSRYYYLVMSVIPIWYGDRWSRRLLLLNALITFWMIADNTSGFILSAWLWFIFFSCLGGTHVYKVIQVIIAHQKS